jgi:transcriptional regulator with XRE-family HTH domain
MEKSLSQRVNEKSLKFRLSGRNLISLLKEKGISKWRLAKDLDISYRTVQYWAKGKLPSDENAEKVAAYLAIKIKESKQSDYDFYQLAKRISAIEKRLDLPAMEEKEGK